MSRRINKSEGPLTTAQRVHEPVRIAMWSGPRNISTAMMRSFGTRDDTHVVDEPFYAAYLAATRIDHPMREAVLGSQPNDWRDVVAALLGPVPDRKPILYQKHMTHHMLADFGRGWMGRMRNAFLIRDPAAVLASYVLKRSEVTLADIGIVRQRELFDEEADRLGTSPPVVDGSDVLRDPARTLSRLCAALGIAYSECMLEWSAGRRATDGVWAPAWYGAVEQSTGFVAPSPAAPVKLPAELERIADAAQPHYAWLAGHKL
jgi:Sulfotransferase domain